MLFIIWLWLGVIQVESHSQYSIAKQYTNGSIIIKKIFGFFLTKMQN